MWERSSCRDAVTAARLITRSASRASCTPLDGEGLYTASCTIAARSAPWAWTARRRECVAISEGEGVKAYEDEVRRQRGREGEESQRVSESAAQHCRARPVTVTVTSTSRGHEQRAHTSDAEQTLPLHCRLMRSL